MFPTYGYFLLISPLLVSWAGSDWKQSNVFQPPASLEKPRAEDVEASWKKTESFFSEDANHDQTTKAEAMSHLIEVFRFVGQNLEDLGLFVVSLTNNLLDLLWSYSTQILGLTSFLSKSRIFRSVSVPPFKTLPNLLKNSRMLLGGLKTFLLKLTNIFPSKVQWFLYFQSSLSKKLVLFIIIIAALTILSKLLVVIYYDEW